MSRTPHVAADCGSLHDDGRTGVALERALAAAAEAGTTTDPIGLGKREVFVDEFGSARTRCVREHASRRVRPPVEDPRR